jgi:acylphosphatase
MQTIELIIKGRVQGVFYRQSSMEKAKELGIKGHARNLPDGDVSIIASGTEHALKELTDWCKKGPPKASVLAVEVREIPFQEFDEFRIIRG